MAKARTKQRTTPSVGTAVAADAPASWGSPAGAGGIALVAAVLTSLGALSPPVGLAVTILGVLALLAERGLATAARAATPGVPITLALGFAWVVACYLPYHALLFPGAPLHEPVRLRAGDPALPVTLPAGGRGAVDVLLEGELPPNPGGGTAIPVSYTITFEDAAKTRQVVTGRFEESLRTQRLGRRGTATVVQAHHSERHVVANAARGDLTVTGVALEPAQGSWVTIAAYAHRLPPLPVLAVLALALLGGAVVVDGRLVPGSDGTLTLATGSALGAAAGFAGRCLASPSLQAATTSEAARTSQRLMIGLRDGRRARNSRRCAARGATPLPRR
jgi:hypothetical protein